MKKEKNENIKNTNRSNISRISSMKKRKTSRKSTNKRFPISRRSQKDPISSTSPTRPSRLRMRSKLVWKRVTLERSRLDMPQTSTAYRRVPMSQTLLTLMDRWDTMDEDPLKREIPNGPKMRGLTRTLSRP
jgi:hypothetical protein